MYSTITIVKSIALLSFAIIFGSCSTNNSLDGIELNWKLDDNDSLVYLTAMEDLEESSVEIDTEGLFDEMFSEDGESVIDLEEISKALSNSLKEKMESTDMITILSNSKDFRDVLDIEMVAIEKTDDNFGRKDSTDADVVDELSAIVKSLVKGTMLRGSINKDGTMHSFWVETRQKNLISVFFELPVGSVKEGDSWKLENISFIQNNQNFKCEKAKRNNEATLVEVKEVKGETIAVIEYDLEEFVSGTFTRSFFGNVGKPKPTTIKYKFKARAEFSVDEGKWVSYGGIMSVKMTGVMNSTKHQKFALIEQ